MEGVTILNTFEVVERAPGWTWWALIPIIMTVTCVVVSCLFDSNCDTLGTLWFGFLAVIFTVTSCLMILTAKELPPVTHYNVIVDESVSFTEFNEKYDVIEQEGRIYTVIERE